MAQRKAKDIADMAFMAATDVFGSSKYRKDDTATNYGWQYNVGKWENGYWHSDCLGFVHIMVNGFFGDRDQLGGGAEMNDFVLMSDEWTTLNKYCSKRGQFPVEELRPASLLQNSGHVGLYIGDHVYNGQTYNTAECTLAFEKGWILTYTDLSTGKRYKHKGGIAAASGWNNWGEFDMVDYTEQTPEPEPEPTPEPEPIVSPFSDVSAKDKTIMWAYKEGIAKGYPDGTFRPDEPCTRRQVCTMLWRFAGKPEV